MADQNIMMAGPWIILQKDRKYRSFGRSFKTQYSDRQTEVSDDKDRKETWPDAMKWAKHSTII